MSALGRLIRNIRKLNNIGRWSNEFLHRRASVSEHTFFVTQLCQLLGAIEEKNGNKVDWKILYEKALNHDMPEAITGDVISTIKNVNDEIRSALTNVEQKLVDELLLQGLDDYYDNFYRSKIFNGKDGTLEGEILKYADHIDALLECVEEIRLGNTSPFIEKYTFIHSKITESDLKSVSYFMLEILPELTKGCDIK